MKTWISWTVGTGLAVTLFALAGVAQDDSTSAAGNQPVSAMADPSATNNPPPPDVAAQNLEDAPGKVVSTPATAAATPADVAATGPVADIVKLVHAGVSEDVLMAYVTNSTTPYNLSSDDIVYLKDIGTPDTVVTTIINRDQALRNNAPAATAQTAPPPVQQPAPPDTTAANNEPQTAPLTPNLSAEQAAAPNVSYTYFYDSLAPYGNWIDVAGYGLCWQPTVVVANPGWQPYCDSGHWVYTDDGWFWVSDYSWGWAPFHYGRWFRHNRWGWCWAPDTVWGPSWVSWRYTDSYCGWAPLPPTACYRPGFGFTYYGRGVDVNFSFGLSADWFIFVPLGHCYDPHPWRYRLPRHDVTRIYNNTVIVNNYVNVRGDRTRIINKGVPVDRVAAAAHTEIKPVRIREHTDGARPAQFERGGKELAVYRPALPEPKPGRNTTLVGAGVQPNPHFNRENRRMPLGNTPGTQQRITNPSERGGREQSVVTPNTPNAPLQSPRSSENIRRDNERVRENNSRENRTTVEPGEKPGSLIYRGPNRQKPSGNDTISQPAPTPPTRREQNRSERAIEAPNRPAAPVQNNPAPSVAPSQPVRTAPLTPESGYNQNRNQERRSEQLQQRENVRQYTPAQPQQPAAPAYQAPRQTEQPQVAPPTYQTPRQSEQPRPAAPTYNIPSENRHERQQEMQQWQQQRETPRATAPLTPSYDAPRQQPQWRGSDNYNAPAVRQQPSQVAPPRVYESRPSAPVQSAPRDYRRDNDNGNGNGRDRGNRWNQ